jgi:phage terminase small subunit
VKNKLTERQKLFVFEYLVDFNAKRAAIRAGYSPHSASTHGPKLLQKPLIKAALGEAQAVRVARTKIDQDFVVNRLVEIVNWGMGPIVLSGNRPGEPLVLHDRDGGAVDKAVQETPVVVQNDMASVMRVNAAVRALGLLAKHTGGFNNNKGEEKNVTVIVDTGVPGPPGVLAVGAGATSSQE